MTHVAKIMTANMANRSQKEHLEAGLVKEEDNEKEKSSDTLKRIESALFYGLTSFLITVVNKEVLTSWHFPSFLVLSLGQLLAAVFVLFVGDQLKVISLVKFSPDIPKRIMPLPLFHLGNMIAGLGATQAVSLPMFTALRRFAILMTMILEIRILGVRPSMPIQLSVAGMIGGAVIAAADDLSFSLVGYSYVMFANIMTAAYGVYVKEKVGTLDIDKYSIMFYNSLLMIVPTLVLAVLTGDVEAAYHYNHWQNMAFVTQFLGSCFMGFVLTYSTYLCSQYNTALTTAMVGCFKNIFVSYAGMFIGGDYVFSIWNLIGINVSIIASIYYTYVIVTT